MQVSSGEDHVVTRSFHDGDVGMPVFRSGKNERFTPAEAVTIILQDDAVKCNKVPLGVRGNLSFLVNTTKLNTWEDVKCDMNGVYEQVLRVGVWTVQVGEDPEDVEIVAKKRIPLEPGRKQFHPRMNSKRNKAGLSRSIFLLEDHHGHIVNSTCLLQYHVDREGCDRVEFEVASHGNRKHGQRPFYPTKKSVMQKMQDRVQHQSSSAVYSNLVSEQGGAVGARQPSDLPRSRQQVYQLNSSFKVANEEEEVLAYLRHLDEPPVLQHHDIPEDLWIIGTPQMCQDCKIPTLSFSIYNTSLIAVPK